MKQAIVTLPKIRITLFRQKLYWRLYNMNGILMLKFYTVSLF